MADFDVQNVSVLNNKRDATRYRILVEIAERQPAVSQREVAEAVDITPQAVSDYLRDLIQEGYVKKEGRGRYEITNEGVDWLISKTDDLRSFLRHVTDDVIGDVEVDAAIATAEITDGQIVHLSMRDGLLHATPGDAGDATAVAVGNADPGQAVGVTDFDGIVEFEPGTVTIVSVPTVGESEPPPDRETIAERADDHDLVATAGTEAYAVSREANLTPDVRFGIGPAVREAATRGLDVLVVAVGSSINELANELREGSVAYELLDTPRE